MYNRRGGFSPGASADDALLRAASSADGSIPPESILTCPETLESEDDVSVGVHYIFEGCEYPQRAIELSGLTIE